MSTFHIYLDESGELNFTPTGSKFYVITVAWTYEPKPIADSLITLRIELLKQGHDLSAFHASEDKQVNRDAVIDTLLSHDMWNFTAVVIEKAKVDPSFHEPHLFYPKYTPNALRLAFDNRTTEETNMHLIITDRLPVAKKRRGVEKAIKTFCRRELPAQAPFWCYHHPSQTNKWLQVVDYCSWAVYRKWEGGDDITYNRLLPKLASPELDVLAHQTTKHY